MQSKQQTHIIKYTPYSPFRRFTSRVARPYSTKSKVTVNKKLPYTTLSYTTSSLLGRWRSDLYYIRHIWHMCLKPLQRFDFRWRFLIPLYLFQGDIFYSYQYFNIYTIKMIFLVKMIFWYKPCLLINLDYNLKSNNRARKTFIPPYWILSNPLFFYIFWKLSKVPFLHSALILYIEEDLVYES